jgi:hypothetical protein
MRRPSPTARAIRQDHTDRDRNGARSAGSCISTAASATPSGKAAIPEHGPHEEVPHTHQRGQPTQARLGCPADGLAVRHSIGTIVSEAPVAEGNLSKTCASHYAINYHYIAHLYLGDAHN